MLGYKYFLEIIHVHEEVYRAIIFEMDPNYFGEVNWSVEDILETEGLENLRQILNNRDKHCCLEWIDSRVGGKDITHRQMWNRAIKNMESDNEKNIS